MFRIRIIFKKSGWITHLNHMDLPNLFSRAAKRAGLEQEYTQGYSPRPRTSFGPPLAIGVEGENEPAEFWFANWDENSQNKWNDNLPEGIKILKSAEVEGPVLSKSSNAAVYEIQKTDEELPERALTVLKEMIVKEAILYQSSFKSGLITLTIGSVERCSAGKMVKTLEENGICSGWSDLQIVRRIVGSWDPKTNSVLSAI